MLHHFKGSQQPGTKVASRKRRARRPRAQEILLTVGPERVEFIIPYQSPENPRTFFSVLSDERWLEGATRKLHLENEDPWLFSRYIVPWLKGSDICGSGAYIFTCGRFSQQPTKALVDMIEVCIVADHYNDLCLMQYMTRAIDDILSTLWDQVKIPGDLLECILVDYPQSEDMTELSRLLLGHVVDVLESNERVSYTARHADHYEACLKRHPRLAEKLGEHKEWKKNMEHEMEEEENAALYDLRKQAEDAAMWLDGQW